MKPIFDRNGEHVSWLDEGVIYTTETENWGYVAFGAFFNSTGDHIGYLVDNYFRDHNGDAIGFLNGARNGPQPPAISRIRFQPVSVRDIQYPTLADFPPPPNSTPNWSSTDWPAIFATQPVLARI